MTTPDETTAWALVRAAADAAPGPWEIRLPGRPELRLSVDADGRWAVDPDLPQGPSRILDLFLPVALDPTAVVGQLGQSLDGRIATRSGDSHYVTGPEDLDRLHRLRALVDAVVVGRGTVASDDPRLTVRRVEGDNPVRVVMDPAGRLGPDRNVFTDGAAPTLVVRRVDASVAVPPGATLVPLPASDEGVIDPGDVLRALRDRGHRRILVEGGGLTVSRFLQAGLLTRLHVTVAPLLVGEGRQGLTLPPVETLSAALRPPSRRFLLGEDVLFDLDLSTTE